MNYKEVLTRIFDHEAIIIILTGLWKTGKTNVGLRLAEDLLDFGIIKVAGTNIKIKSTETFKFIEDFETLKKFHYDHPRRPKPKLYIFDEAGKIAVRRGAMRKMNVEWMSFIPELSKGKMKLLVITQSEKLTDSLFLNTDFTRATIRTHKSKEYGYTVSINSELLPSTRTLFVNDFPKTTIPYSPYQSAEFYLERQESEALDLLCCQIARLYAVDKLSSTKIANKKGWDRAKVMRYIQRHIRHTLGALTEEDLEELRKDPIIKPPDDVDRLSVQNIA